MLHRLHADKNLFGFFRIFENFGKFANNCLGYLNSANVLLKFKKIQSRLARILGFTQIYSLLAARFSIDVFKMNFI
jgi:hypothetical protein